MDDLTKQKITHTVRGVLKSKEEGTYLVRPEHHKKQFTVVNGIRHFFFSFNSFSLQCIKHGSLVSGTIRFKV